MMKTKFMMEGSNVSVVRMNEETALDHLPAKVYSLNFNKIFGFYLSIVKDRLPVPEKIYGNATVRAEKCIQTYRDRDTSMGILMTGDKGTGKTLLTALLANKTISDLFLPVILVKEAYSGEQFSSFVESLGECCLVFDEFGKMYSSRRNDEGSKQEDLLSLIDGVDKIKRLVVMTENNISDISEFLLNRPSRIYYHFRYNKLDEDSIVGYCDDNGVSSAIAQDLVDLSRRSTIFSFDMLQSIVEEHLRFGSSVADTIVDLNIDIRQAPDVNIEITKVICKTTGYERELLGKTVVARPMFQYDYTYVKLKPVNVKQKSSKKHISVEELAEVCGSSEDADEIHFDVSDLAYESAGQLVYETNKYTIVAKELPMKRSTYFDLF